jgi:nicotinamide mononucleotide transporter
MHQLHDLLIAQLKETTLLQWLAVLLGIAEVLLARSNNIWLYPTGILSTLISIYLLMEVNLYADSALNVYYVVMSVYGWMYWLKKGGRPTVPITVSGRADWAVMLAIVFIGWPVLYLLLKLTPSNVPVWDALVASTGWAGMWLLAKRKLENWLLLNVSNLFAIPLLFYKQLPLFGLLTIFLFLIAFWGYYDWRKEVKKQTAPILIS